MKINRDRFITTSEGLRAEELREGMPFSCGRTEDIYMRVFQQGSGITVVNLSRTTASVYSDTCLFAGPIYYFPDATLVLVPEEGGS